MAELPPPVTPPPTVRSLADEILARKEFHRDPPSIFERALSWLGDRIGDVARSASGANLGVLGYLAIALLLGGVGFALWRAFRAFQLDPGGGGGVVVDGVRRPAADWRAEAAGHEAAGRWRDALRCHWRALVADLAAKGLVQEVPGRTTGEYRAAVTRSAPTVAGPFADATALFEAAWYAASEVGPEDNARCRDLSREVLVGAGR